MFKTVKNGLAENLYLFCSLKSGGSVVYQLVDFANQKRLKQIRLFGQSLHMSRSLEDKFAFLHSTGRANMRILQQKPFRVFVQDGVENVFIGQPVPSSQSEPIAFVAAPTLQGALSFYQIGRQSTSMRAGDSKSLLFQQSFPPRDLLQTSLGLLLIGDVANLN